MGGTVIGFAIWAIVGAVIIGIGISAFFMKKVVGFWANIKPIAVKDIRGYNYATGRLYISYGLIFIVLVKLTKYHNSDKVMITKKSYDWRSL